MIAALDWIFWVSTVTVLAVTFGYPLFLALSWPIARKHRVLDGAEPSVSLIIAAYNEESVIADKLENSLAIDYPRDKLEVIVASDGSSDGTDRIVAGYRDRGIQLHAFPRTGKTGVQNRMAVLARGEILVFSDANAHYEPDAIRKLVRNFADPIVGGVCGQLEYRATREAAGASESVYWSYEKFIKRRESDLSSLVGANGSIYAVRRSDYVAIDDGLISDFVEPLALVRNGKRMVYEPAAISIEDASTSYGSEYRRKVRILTRSILGLLSMRELMNPFRFGIFAVQLIVHKLLRFLTPLFLMTGGVALTGLALAGEYRVLFAIGLAGVVLALAIGRNAGSRAARPNVIVQACSLAYYYLMVNYALVLAWLNVLRGNRMKLWSPERKQA